MSSLPIYFFSEDISYKLKDKLKIRKWLHQAILSELRKLKEINFIFCTDNYLLGINQQYLNHDTYTDIVTFDTSDSPDKISADIFISLERIRENATTFNATERDEIHRVMIHGTLHLLGYKDKLKADKIIMTTKENHYLNLRDF